MVPGARYGAGQVLLDGSLIVYGGYDNERALFFSDVWAFDFTVYNITGLISLFFFKLKKI